MVINSIHDFSYINVCINYKCYISIELMFLKEAILIKQVHQKSTQTANRFLSSIRKMKNRYLFVF